MPFAAFDYEFCSNKQCPQWGANPCCGRSTHNFEGKQILLWMGQHTPDETGKCADYMEPQHWEVEPWMEEMAKEAAEKTASK